MALTENPTCDTPPRRFFRWLVTEKSAAQRLAAYVLVVVVGFLGFLDDASDDARERAARRREEAATVDRRINGRAQLYAGCQEDNRQNVRDDKALQDLFAPFLAQPANAERTSRTLDLLRFGLNESDCEAVLSTLAVDEADRARTLAMALPRKPLPPPTVPGYVAPTTPTTMP